MSIVTCGGCGLKIDRSIDVGAEYIKSKWYHSYCASIKKEKMLLDEYICKIFELKATGPTNNSLIKKYKEQYGYNYDGMLKALKYFYEVQKHSPNKSEERVGIIPYVYDEAQEYFKAREQKINRIGEHGLEHKAKEITVKIYTTKVEKNKKSNSLDELFNEE